MKILTLLVALLPLHAAVYYVDRTLGSDSNNGLSAAGAWRTLARIQSQPLGAGDYVLLKRGEIWGERLSIGSSGLPEAPITFGAYGDGARPLLDGSRIPARDVDVVSITGSNIVISGLEIRNSAKSGVNAYRCSRLTLRDLLIAANRFNGVLTYDCSAVLIEDSEISGNSLETSVAYDGIRIDGSGGELSGFRLRNNLIHHNIGGEDWNSANGIFLGHTGANIPTLHAVRITGNDIYANGNPNQNQAGRGVSGVLQGDVTLSGNYVYRNASAGIYLGDRQLNLDLTFTNNVFVNNALRQFGGFTNTFAHAEHNLLISDDASITAMGIEIGGEGRWEVVNNVFAYPTATDDTYRAFIRLNDTALERTLSSDWNLFYSAGPNRWKLANGIPIDFSNWQSAGFDKHSRSPK